MSKETDITFGLVHGSWHGAWCWLYLQKELDINGYESVVMDLPIENPKANFHDYAETVAESLDMVPDESEIVLVGHSRGANVIPRVAGMLAVKKLIYLCGGLDDTTIGHPTQEEIDAGFTMDRNPPDFGDAMIPLGKSLYMFDKDWAINLFYHDCSDDIKEFATSHLRNQYRLTGPQLDKMPDIPQEYIICTEDRVISPEWSRYVCKHWLKIEPTEMPGGHSPFLSRPQELARLLISLAA